jgi:hypothetical protein
VSFSLVRSARLVISCISLSLILSSLLLFLAFSQACLSCTSFNLINSHLSCSFLCTPRLLSLISYHLSCSFLRSPRLVFLVYLFILSPLTFLALSYVLPDFSFFYIFRLKSHDTCVFLFRTFCQTCNFLYIFISYLLSSVLLFLAFSQTCLSYISLSLISSHLPCSFLTFSQTWHFLYIFISYLLSPVLLFLVLSFLYIL